MRRVALGAVLGGVVALAAASVLAPPPGAGPAPAPVAGAVLVAAPVSPSPARPAAPPAPPLAGLRIALDPGHQLGNHNFPSRINAPVGAGGFTKPCNTTGTATNAGYPEATANFRIASAVKRRLEKLGATVLMTRTSNSESLWGPCVDVRGKFGKKVGAVLEVSLHADGTRASGRGFHVISPTSRKPWTDDVAKASRRLARALRAGLDAEGLPRSNYLAGGTGLVRRSDLGTLNLSDVPIAMIEVGNMRNAREARRLASSKGRARYADAVVAGIRRYLHR